MEGKRAKEKGKKLRANEMRKEIKFSSYTDKMSKINGMFFVVETVRENFIHLFLSFSIFTRISMSGYNYNWNCHEHLITLYASNFGDERRISFLYLFNSDVAIVIILCVRLRECWNCFFFLSFLSAFFLPKNESKWVSERERKDINGPLQQWKNKKKINGKPEASCG